MRQISRLAISRLAALLLLAVLPLGCGKGAPTSPLAEGPPPPPPVSGPTDPEVVSFVQQINAHRVSLGIAPLIWDGGVAAVAQGHSQDMLDRGYFSHTTPEGLSPWDRLAAAGIAYTTAGENIAWGYSTGSAVLSGWLGSPGHKANIENASFSHHGVGKAGTYWTHVFIHPTTTTASAPQDHPSVGSVARPAAPGIGYHARLMPEPRSSETEAFKVFEQQGWESVALPYRDAFSPLTTQSVGHLLDAVAAGPGVRLLDVACGPGDAAAGAAKRGAIATGVDFAAAMVAQASRLHPGVGFRAGDAEQLPFDDAVFDAVVINFGVLHFARPDRAIAEAHRVLSPGGRFAFTVWSPPEKCEGFAVVLNAIEAHGRMDVALPEGPPFFRFSDHDECRRVLSATGFSHAAVRELPMRWRLPAPEALLDAFLDGGVRTRGLLRAQTPGALAAIRVAARSEAARYARGDGVEFAMPAVLASGVKG